MEFNFKEKKALVTGAGKGIGRGIAAALWAGGATVYALSRTQSDLDSLQTECPGLKGVRVDLQNWAETREAVTGVGDVDLLVNNAGHWNPTSVLDTPEESFTAVMNVNVKAVVNISQIVAKGMVARRSGAIVNISSFVSQSYLESFYVNSAAKAALNQLTRCQAVELGPHQIRVNAIIPPVVRTDMAARYMAEHESGPVDRIVARMPISHMAEVKDIVNATLYLLSDKADMINGAILPVDGGFSCT